MEQILIHPWISQNNEGFFIEKSTQKEENGLIGYLQGIESERNESMQMEPPNIIIEKVKFYSKESASNTESISTRINS